MMIDRVAEQDGRVLEFGLLSDPDHSVIDRYGLLNQMDPQQRPIPHPTVFLVDQDGIVRWKFIEINYKIRPTNSNILEALEALQEGGMVDGEMTDGHASDAGMEGGGGG